MNLLTIFAILLSLFGGIGLSATSGNRNAVIAAIGLFGNIALILCLVAVMAAMSFQHCSEYRQLCSISNFFMSTLHIPSADNALLGKAVIATGWFGAICVYLFIALASAKERTYTVLAFLGVTALILGSSIALYQTIA